MLKHAVMIAVTVLAFGGTGATQAPASFDVASVKPNNSDDARQRMGPQVDRFIAINVPLRDIIQAAYGVYPDQIINGPGWIDERFDINAKAQRPFTSRDEWQPMLRTLLADRFKLVTHVETRSATNYFLRVKSPGGKFGPSLRKAATDCAGLRAGAPPAADPCGMMTNGRAGITGRMQVRGLSLANLVALLERELRAPVKDETALTGTFDWELTFRPMFTATGPLNRERFPDIDPDAPLITVAVQEQMGLELKSKEGTVSLLAIDRVERPTAD